MGSLPQHYRAFLDQLREADLPVTYSNDDGRDLHYYLALRLAEDGVLDVDVDDGTVTVTRVGALEVE